MLSKSTSDHTDIFFWADYHQAIPAEILSEGSTGREPVLSFLFHRPSVCAERVRPISWEEFFAVFDLYEFSFIYEEQPTSSTRFLFLTQSALAAAQCTH